MPRFRSGFALAELLVVTIVIGVLMLVAVPRFAAMRDSASVQAAVAETARMFASARELAVVRREFVAVVIDAARGAVEIRSRGRTLARRHFGEAYHVALGTNRDSLVYDPRGLGFGISNLSLVIRRGRAADTIVVSRLGRTRW
jgi:prepilin-type N-terminal cleavage/methylation domain-containing protein